MRFFFSPSFVILMRAKRWSENCPQMNNVSQQINCHRKAEKGFTWLGDARNIVARGLTKEILLPCCFDHWASPIRRPWTVNHMQMRYLRYFFPVRAPELFRILTWMFHQPVGNSLFSALPWVVLQAVGGFLLSSGWKRACAGDSVVTIRERMAARG